MLILVGTRIVRSIELFGRVSLFDVQMCPSAAILGCQIEAEKCVSRRMCNYFSWYIGGTAGIRTTLAVSGYA